MLCDGAFTLTLESYFERNITLTMYIYLEEQQSPIRINMMVAEKKENRRQ